MVRHSDLVTERGPLYKVKEVDDREVDEVSDKNI